MEKFNTNKTKQEPDTLKKSDTAPKAQVHVTSIPQKDQPKPSTSVAVANQLIQPEESAKAGLVDTT